VVVGGETFKKFSFGRKRDVNSSRGQFPHFYGGGGGFQEILVDQ